MSFLDILRTAISNTFRSKLRTTLTVIAIFIGAFTITVTSAIGTGVNSYITTQVAAAGNAGTLLVTKTVESTGNGDGPAKYDPDSAGTTVGDGGQSLEYLTAGDIDKIKQTSGITRVRPAIALAAKWVEYGDNGKYVVDISADAAHLHADLASGHQLDDDASENQLLIPSNDLKSLGLGSAKHAVGKQVTIGVSDYLGKEHQVRATIAGVQNETLIGGGASANETLTDAIQSVQQQGKPSSVATTYSSATAVLKSGASASHVKHQLSERNYTGQTVQDVLGQFQTVVNGIIGVLDAFAVIALVAAGFGIVNTLLMSVQERTREIGLMKAMGMSGGRVFTLFSVEAVFIGFLGSAIGAGVAIGVGTAISGFLGSTVLKALPGLHILQFAPASVAGIIIVVMAIAFLAGTLPARRAARQNPIEALRYE